MKRRRNNEKTEWRRKEKGGGVKGGRDGEVSVREKGPEEKKLKKNKEKIMENSSR